MFGVHESGVKETDFVNAPVILTPDYLGLVLLNRIVLLNRK